MTFRFSFFVATASLAAASHGFVLIDDFTVGGFTTVLSQQHSFSKEEFGLDKTHVAFGTRQNSIRIDSNPNNTELSVHVGGGEQALRSPLPVTWDHDLGFGDLHFEVDFSAETEFWVDFETAHPRDAGADNWDLLVMDADGVTASFRELRLWMSSNGAMGRFPDWAEIIAVAEKFHVLPSEVRAMPARDFEQIIGYMNCMQASQKERARQLAEQSRPAQDS